MNALQRHAALSGRSQLTRPQHLHQRSYQLMKTHSYSSRLAADVVSHTMTTQGTHALANNITDATMLASGCQNGAWNGWELQMQLGHQGLAHLSLEQQLQELVAQRNAALQARRMALLQQHAADEELHRERERTAERERGLKAHIGILEAELNRTKGDLSSAQADLLTGDRLEKKSLWYSFVDSRHRSEATQEQLDEACYTVRRANAEKVDEMNKRQAAEQALAAAQITIMQLLSCFLRLANNMACSAQTA